MISLIIPNYNGQENLKENLPKLLNFFKDKEIIIVDDKSTDESINVVKDFSAANKNLKVRLIEAPKNKGFSSTVNTGVANANGDIIILLNTDAYVKKFDESKLQITFVEDDKVFAIGFMDESRENDKIISRGRGIGKWQRGFLVHAKGSVDKNNSLWASGGSAAFSKKNWQAIGGLNEIYNPFYWEDLDISYRALRSGYKVLFDRNFVVVHEHEKGVIKKTFTQSQIKKIAFRNQFFLVWINGSFRNVLGNLLWFPYHVVKSMERGESEFAFGFIQALLHAPQVFSSRRRVQKLFVKGDREVEVLE